MRTLTARPALRWLVPLAVLLVALGSFLIGTRATASPALPERSAEQLLVDLQTAKVAGLSGTIVQTADLGIPAIPGASDSGSAASKLTGLISGTHTMGVWYSGTNKARLALQDQYAETDVITNGSDVWTYSSDDKTATHTTLSADQAKAGEKAAPSDAPKTPQEAATMALDAIGTTTDVTTDRAVSVAGHDAYELVLKPKDKASLITQVRIAIDGATHIPLRVQVFGSDDKPAFEVGYDSLSIGAPDDRMFSFNPPEGTKVTQQAAPTHKSPTAAEKKALEADNAKADENTTVVGTGWTSVVVTKLPSGATDDATLSQFLGQLKPGADGSRELDGTIMTVILTKDGRVGIGAVGPELVQQALAK